MNYLNEVASLPQLNAAWEHVKKKKDVTPGIDGETVDGFAINLNNNLKSISSELKSKKYKFNSALETEIPKKNSSKIRKIRIFTIKDKIVQRSIQLSFEKQRRSGSLFPEIRNSISIGFLQRVSSSEFSGVKKAVEEIKKHYKKGYIIMTAADIKDFFDEIDKKKLFTLIQSRLHPDDSLDWLVSQLLDTKVCKKDRFSNMIIDKPMSISGVGQGSIISPLLSNIYLMSFDKEVEKLGIPALRYADDFAYFSKTITDGKENLPKIAKILLKEASLSFHPDKSKAPKHYDLKHRFGVYLGVKFQRGNVGRWIITPIESKVNDLYRKIRDKLANDNNATLFGRIDFTNRCLKSWMDCYKYLGCTSKNLKKIYADAVIIYEGELNKLLKKNGITKHILTRKQLTFLGVMRIKEVYKRKK